MKVRNVLACVIVSFSFCPIVQCGGSEERKAAPVCITVTERYFDKPPHMEYGSAVDFLGKKKYWHFKYELYSSEGNSFDSKEYLRRFPYDAVWKFYTGDGQYGVKIWTNNLGEKQRDGFIKVKVMTPPGP